MAYMHVKKKYRLTQALTVPIGFWKFDKVTRNLDNFKEKLKFLRFSAN